MLPSPFYRLMAHRSSSFEGKKLTTVNRKKTPNVYESNEQQRSGYVCVIGMQIPWMKLISFINLIFLSRCSQYDSGFPLNSVCMWKCYCGMVFRCHCDVFINSLPLNHSSFFLLFASFCP